MRIRNTSSRLARRTSTDCRADAVVRQQGCRVVAGVGVDEQAVGDGFDPRRPLPHAVERVLQLHRPREPQLHHLTRGVLGHQLARRAFGDDLPAVHDHQPVAELLRLVHVVGGEHERDAVLLEPVQALPEHVPGLRVEAGGGLVEQQHLGLVDQRTCDREPPLHPARKRVDARVAAVAELHELEELLRTPADLGAGQVEVAPVDHEVVPDRELGVEVVLLRHHAEPAADLGAVGGRVEAEHVQHPARDGRNAADHPHRGALARPVGTEEPERLARLDHEVDTVDRDERPEPFGEHASFDERTGHGRRTYFSGETADLEFSGRAALNCA